jgi:branched-subunit amino acid transport protein
VRAWTVIVIAALGTYALRASVIVLLGRITVPSRLERSLRYVAPAVLAAIAVPAVLAPGGVVDLADARVPAAILAAVAAWRFGTVLATLVAGLGSYALLGLVL